jgi:phage shock protein PspC (stress-responsive transcriptional regulator)
MNKKLIKSDDRIICGVCGGIADYLGIDQTIVRLGAVFLTCCFGFGIIPYIVAAIVMPDE